MNMSEHYYEKLTYEKAFQRLGVDYNSNNRARTMVRKLEKLGFYEEMITRVLYMCLLEEEIAKSPVKRKLWIMYRFVKRYGIKRRETPEYFARKKYMEDEERVERKLMEDKIMERERRLG